MTDPQYDDMSEEELALRLNGLEHVMWWTQHDAADGRIDNEQASDTLAELEEKRDTIADVLYDRTGFDDHDALSSYVQNIVDSYEDTVERYEEGEIEDPTADEETFIELYEELN
ncbi:MAG: hypothetical protein MUP66_02530 [Candidatus Nanohaloarchaeota archaeon QJJ-5]|nr:hypothetical protein [Candidatus Nanohaloarchaeota archaeon QJJ-5]